MFKVAVHTAIFVVITISFLLLSKPSYALTTNMNASVVVGQYDFTSTSSGTNQIKLNDPVGICVWQNKLVVADRGNSRVLIWNNIPTSNGQPADVVVGQPNFNSATANNGGVSASSLNLPFDVDCTNGRLIIADTSNNRILIYNSIPTTNGTSASVVVGQSSMTANSAQDGDALNGLESPLGVSSDGQERLFIIDSKNQRALIYNSIPTTNGASANVVIGSAGGNGCAASQLAGEPEGIYSNGQRLFVANTFPGGGHRVLIWNSIPATNNQSADVVVGQPDFTTCTSNYGGIGANTLSTPFDMTTDAKGRLYISDYGNQRFLVYNNIPTSNFASADLVIGQANFTSSSSNQGGSAAANTIAFARRVHVDNNKVFITDSTNNRILIFDEVFQKPGLSLTNTPIGVSDGKLRISGRATVDSLYAVSKIEYSVNGGAWHTATATDGSLNSSVENFYFDFDKSENGNSLDGYNIRLRAQNTNLDETERVFFFEPFVINSPKNDRELTCHSEFSSESKTQILNQVQDDNGVGQNDKGCLPTFDFSVNKQRIQIRDNLERYQIQIAKSGTEDWKTYIDNIPVDFQMVKNLPDNLRRSFYQNAATNNGVYETNLLTAAYSEESSRVSVTPKDIVSHLFPFGKKLEIGQTYKWKVVAIDKVGHSQETGTQTLKIESKIPNYSAPSQVGGTSTEEELKDATGHPLPSPAPSPSPRIENEEDSFCVWFLCWPF